MGKSAHSPRPDVPFMPPGHVGSLLQEARLRQGHDLRIIADDLRIRYHYLLAIEGGRYEDLPGPTYAAGFVRAYAEYLGLPVEDTLRRFRDETQPRANRPTQLDFPTPANDGGMPAGAFLLVALIVAGCAYGMWFWLSSNGKTMADLIPDMPAMVANLVSDWTTTAPPGLNDTPPAADATTDADTAGDGDENTGTTLAAPASPPPLVVASADGGTSGSEADAPILTRSAGSLEALLDGPMGDPPAVASDADSASGRPVETASDAAPAADDGARNAPVDAPAPRAAIDVPPLSAPGDTPAVPPRASALADATSAPEPEQTSDNGPDTSADTSAETGTEIGTGDPSAAATPTPDIDPPPRTAAVPGTADGAPDTEDPATAETAETAETGTDTEPGTPERAEARTTVETSAAGESAAIAPRATDVPAVPETAETAAVPDTAPEPRAQPVVDEPDGEPEDEPEPAYVGRAAPPDVRAAGGNARIVLRADRDAWIQLRRDGELVLRRLLRRGDVYAIPAGGGYVLNTSNAGGLEVYVDGRRVRDLGPVGAPRNGVRLSPRALN